MPDDRRCCPVCHTPDPHPCRCDDDYPFEYADALIKAEFGEDENDG